MGSASVSAGFGKRVPNNPAFQQSRSNTFGQNNNAFRGTAGSGQRSAAVEAPAMSGSSQNNYHGLSNEVAASFYESSSSDSFYGASSFNGYAGFWIRVLAYFIDSAFLAFLFYMLGAIAGAVGYQLASSPSNTEISQETALGILATILAIYVIGGLITLFYFVAMESSPLQATLGKLALGLRVEDMNGKRIGFGRALCRYLAKFISGIILCIGYIMVGFSAKKQALHDVICSTCVVK